jgi:glyoxylase-like metal-dependent hydrolase (beta-lactamase superfamily II)
MQKTKILCVYFAAAVIVSFTIFGSIAAGQQNNFKVVAVTEGIHNMVAGEFESTDTAILKKYMPSGSAAINMSSFVLFAGDDIILIDAGLGGPNWVKGLTDLGVKTEKIKLILLTHLHGDHIGGLLDGNARRFPNAVILCATPEYDYWFPKDSKPLTPELEKIKAAYGGDFSKTFEFDEQVFANDSVKVKALNAVGHTPGHTAFLFESEKNRYLIVGDMLHVAALQFPAPDACSIYDMDPKSTVASRIRILDFAAKENIPVGGMHFPSPNIGTVKKDGQGGYKFTPQEKK